MQSHYTHKGLIISKLINFDLALTFFFFHKRAWCEEKWSHAIQERIIFSEPSLMNAEAEDTTSHQELPCWSTH